jgi:hypothetical protein
MRTVQRENQRLVPYHLSTEIVTLSANQQATLVVAVPGDADFEARYITAKYTSGLLTMVVRDSGTRLEIQNRATYVPNMAGTGAQPYVLPSPGLFVRNCNIELVVADTSGAENTFQITLCGFLVYPGPVNYV